MRVSSFVLVPASALVLLETLEACDKSRHDPASASLDASASTTSAEVDGAAGGDAGPAAKNAGEHRLILQVAAASFVASVSDVPDWPENDAGAKRLGYLRNGAIVSAYDPPIQNEECKEGWYELVEGGYVCGKAATIDLANPRVKHAPKQPDRDAGMPYRYGVNVVDGTPLYRRVLSAEDRRKYEHVPSSKTDKTDDKQTAENEAKDDEPPLASNEDEAPPPRRHSHDKHSRDGDRGRDRDHEKVKDPFKSVEGGRPNLKELKGRGVLVRKLARGFTIALDREFKAAGTRWWRTTFGFAVPFDKIAAVAGVARHTGNWFTGEAATADLLPFPNLSEVGAPHLDGVDQDGAAPVPSPQSESLVGAVAFVTSSGAHKLDVGEDGKGGFKVGWGAELPKKSAILLTGREQTVSGVVYHQTSGGFWIRLPELRLAHPSIPADVGVNERWIDVDLTRQQLVAFEGRRPVFATLVSSGRRNPQDKEHDFPTPPGTFRIREKHVTATMDADVASDGPYSIEDVPWVMYFQGSYAFHGTFWHDGFGSQRSHGCVNLSPDDARTLFAWSDPPLPMGWHGVFSKDESSGSRVIIHEDPPPKRH